MFFVLIVLAWPRHRFAFWPNGAPFLTLWLPLPVAHLFSRPLFRTPLYLSLSGPVCWAAGLSCFMSEVEIIRSALCHCHCPGDWLVSPPVFYTLVSVSLWASLLVLAFWFRFVFITRYRNPLASHWHTCGEHYQGRVGWEGKGRERLG